MIMAGGDVILAGDVGGTNTRFGLFRLGDETLEPIVIATYASQSISSLEQAVETFLATYPARVSVACFGVAGPVINGVCNVTNLPWVVSEQQIKAKFGFGKVVLVNDLLAMAHAIDILTTDDLFVVQSAEGDPRGNVAILAPGTGLGVAFLFNVQGVMHAVPSQGGHVDFAPSSDQDIYILKALRKKFHRVSLERVASGSGMVAIYRALRDSQKWRRSWSGTCVADAISPSLITQKALETGDPLCVEAVRTFLAIIGSAAGNLMLTCMTTKGMYLGGGILPHIVPLVREGVLLEALLNKGQFRDILRQVPVYVILNHQTGLLGAARLAKSAVPMSAKI